MQRKKPNGMSVRSASTMRSSGPRDFRVDWNKDCNKDCGKGYSKACNKDWIGV